MKYNIFSTHRLNIVFFIIVYIIASKYPIVASVKKVSSTVTAVTVFTDRASITRTLSEQLNSGLNTLVIGGLPVILLDRSLRVEGETEGKAKILDVKITTVYLDTIPEERIKSLQDKLKALKAEEKALFDKLQIIKVQKEYVDSLRMYSARDAKPFTTTQKSVYDEWEKMLSFLDRKLNALYAEIRSIAQQIEEIRNKIVAIEKQIQQTQAYSRKSEKNVAVTMDITKAGLVKLKISYLLYGASWTPLYEFRVPSNENDLQIVYAGLVRQSTGEDWNNVDITLSTARPAIGGTIPELATWYIDIAQQAPRYGMKKFRQESAMEAAPKAAPPPEAETTSEAIETEDAEVELQATSAVFKIPSKADIPSDNNPHKVPVAVIKCPVEREYFSIPKISELVFLRGKVKNTSEYPLLAGGANVFFDNNFVANTEIKTILPGELYEMSLGIDEGVKVERKLINKVTEYTGLVTKSTKINYEFVFKAENKKSFPIVLTVKDQIPLSKNEKIVVQVTAPEPKELTQDASGFFVWKLNLKPAEKREFPFKFNIEYPSGLQVIGIE